MEFLKVSRSGGNQITYWKEVFPGNFRPTDEVPEGYSVCEVCETPIINNNCAHKELGYSPEQWRERIESAQHRAQRIGLWTHISKWFCAIANR